jgi:hypothetical protein
MESQVGHPQSNTDTLLPEDVVAKVKTGLPYESSFELHYPVLKQIFLKHSSSNIEVSDSNLESVNARFPHFTKWFKTMKRDYTDYVYGFDTQLSKEMYKQLKAVNFTPLNIQKGKKAVYKAMQILTVCVRDNKKDPFTHETLGGRFKRSLYDIQMYKPVVSLKKQRQFADMNVPISHLLKPVVRSATENERRVENACHDVLSELNNEKLIFENNKSPDSLQEVLQQSSNTDDHAAIDQVLNKDNVVQPTTDKDNEVLLKQMSYWDLVKLCKKNDIKSKGTKDKLVERLLERNIEVSGTK